MKVKQMALLGLMTAILCMIAPFSVPIPGNLVPISMGTFGVYLISSLIGRKKGVLCVFLYLMLGMVGIPVFAGWSGGFHKLAGPTGGYLIGYLFIAFFTGLAAERFQKKISLYSLGMVIGTIICYAFGTIWLSIQNATGIFETFSVAVLPFLPGDLIKIIAVVLILYPLKKSVRKELLES